MFWSDVLIQEKRYPPVASSTFKILIAFATAHSCIICICTIVLCTLCDPKKRKKYLWCWKSVQITPGQSSSISSKFTSTRYHTPHHLLVLKSFSFFFFLVIGPVPLWVPNSVLAGTSEGDLIIHLGSSVPIGCEFETNFIPTICLWICLSSIINLSWCHTTHQ